MSAAPRPQLREQCAYVLPGVDTGDTGDTVVVIQLWSGFARSRAAVVTITDGRRTNMRCGNLRGMQRAYEVLGHCGVGLITDADARSRLAVKGIHRSRCGTGGCTAELPIGELWCGACGAAHNARQD